MIVGGKRRGFTPHRSRRRCLLYLRQGRQPLDPMEWVCARRGRDGDLDRCGLRPPRTNPIDRGPGPVGPGRGAVGWGREERTNVPLLGAGAEPLRLPPATNPALRGAALRDGGGPAISRRLTDRPSGVFQKGVFPVGVFPVGVLDPVFVDPGGRDLSHAACRSGPTPRFLRRCRTGH